MNLINNIWTIIGLLAFGLMLLLIVAQAPIFFAVTCLLLSVIICFLRRRARARAAR